MSNVDFIFEIAPNSKSSKLEIDNINARIISHLVNAPNMKSKELAEILKIPLSTVQRRRAFLEQEGPRQR